MNYILGVIWQQLDAFTFQREHKSPQQFVKIANEAKIFGEWGGEWGRAAIFPSVWLDGCLW